MQQFLTKGQQPLTEKLLHELVSDRGLHLEAIDFDARVHYLPDGHLTATTRQGVKDTGKWTITADDQLCMKFNLWYFGDRKCYTIFKENDTYVFFTTNGARYYTGMVSSDNAHQAADLSGSQNSDGQEAGQSGSRAVPDNDDPGPAVFISDEEKKHALLSLARNCPACNFAGVDLRGAQLIAANLSGANLSGADLRDANMRRANLAGANLTGAKLARTNFAGADLTGCDLSGADLTGSNLIRAKVTGANFTGALLSGAHLESIQGLKE